MSRGLFITFEGCDGVGKSTQIRLLAQKLETLGRTTLELREPGATRIGEKIREILLDANNAELTSEAELLLYEAARAQMVAEVVSPALDAGMVVLCDRFYDSTTAYQGFARGLDLNLVDRLNHFVAHGAIPDKTIFLDIGAGERVSRMTDRDERPDRLESEGDSFQERVREGFLYAARKEPERVSVVDASGSIEETAARIETALAGRGLFEGQGVDGNS